MKQFVLLLTLILGSPVATGAGAFYDLDAELGNAKRLIYIGEIKQAIEILKDAVASEPQNADAWNLLGYASRKMGDMEQSAEAYNKALGIDPNHKDALEYQGELFLMLGDKTSAEGNLAKLKLLCPGGCEQVDSLTGAIAATD